MFYRLPACLPPPPGLQFPAVRPDGPRRLQAPGHRLHADGFPADDGNQRHHVLRREHFRAGSFQGESAVAALNVGLRSFGRSSRECVAVLQESDLASVIVGAIQVIFTAAAALIMDKAGRKFLLIVSGIFSRQENEVQ